MSNNRGSKNSSNYKSSRKTVNYSQSKSQTYKSRDKPKYNSGTKPRSSARDRGIDNPKRRRPNNRSNNRAEGRSNPRTNYRSNDGTSSQYNNRRPNNRSGNSSRNRSDGKPRQEFKATCSACGKPTTLPFKPTGSKPVYCRDCFQDHKPRDRDSARPRRSSDRTGGKLNYRSGDRQRRRYDNKTRTRADGQNYEAICSACGKKTTLPFKPTGIKPVFCRECFKKQETQETVVEDKEPVERFGDRKGPYRVNKRMHQTNCRECNELILVPFKPTKNKLIYCPDCYDKLKKKKN